MIKKATFALGCFWHPDAFFSKIRGVTKVTVGYTGGKTERPTYSQVCGGKTGHAEAVEIEFDPNEISYAELLALFWSEHDPTTVNRQGADIGEQYRSVIFFHDEEQRALAERSKSELEQSGRFKGRIVTDIAPAQSFYPAEEYHQKYAEKHNM
jgi:peptide-methionine (S)-S-oxide reductase